MKLIANLPLQMFVRISSILVTSKNRNKASHCSLIDTFARKLPGLFNTACRLDWDRAAAKLIQMLLVCMWNCGHSAVEDNIRKLVPRIEFRIVITFADSSITHRLVYSLLPDFGALASDPRYLVNICTISSHQPCLNPFLAADVDEVSICIKIVCV